MKIIQITETEIFQTLVIFADGVRVGTLKPEFNHNQPGPCVEPCMFLDQAWPYIEAATKAVSELKCKP
jgi:hypothetical protein